MGLLAPFQPFPPNGGRRQVQITLQSRRILRSHSQRPSTHTNQEACPRHGVARLQFTDEQDSHVVLPSTQMREDRQVSSYNKVWSSHAGKASARVLPEGQRDQAGSAWRETGREPTQRPELVCQQHQVSKKQAL